MVILIDAGNSRLKWAVNGKSDMQVNYLPYAGTPLQTVQQLIEGQSANIDSICVVHVLGEEFEQGLVEFCNHRAISCRIFHSSAYCCGVSNAYQKPQKLGADRFVALIAAHRLFSGQDIIVVDCGTAVTIDALDKTGMHLGGLILPGLQLSSNALINNTHLQASFINKEPELFAKNTLDAVNSGSFYGLSGAIRHIYTLMNKKAFAHPAKMIICGGDSALVAENLMEDNGFSDKLEVIPELVIKGLNIINEKQPG